MCRTSATPRACSASIAARTTRSVHHPERSFGGIRPQPGARGSRDVETMTAALGRRMPRPLILVLLTPNTPLLALPAAWS
jgi:hypothetical protein